MAMTILDGPLGTALADVGIAMPAPRWSAVALETAPEAVRMIHASYCAAGADVVTANTFRTTARAWGDGWQQRVRQAVELARDAVVPGVRVAGSIAPLEDCYRPDLSPGRAEQEHRLLAEALASAGCDILLCETFPQVDEALAAVRAAASTGVSTWAALTAGPDADLLTPAEVGDAARAAVDAGASVVLVNCIPASRTLPYVEAISGCGVPFGAYANAGRVDEGMGWGPAPDAATRYLEHAATWVDAGATMVGSCCGTPVAVTRGLAARYGRRTPGA